MSFLHIIVAVLAVLYIFVPERRSAQKWFYWAAACFVLFCSCFRTIPPGDDYDTRRYIEYFKMFRDLSMSDSLKWGFESGYIVLNKAIGYLTGDPQAFLAILSLLTLTPILCLTWKKSANPILSLLVFVAVGNLFSSYAALRQWCAVAILVLGYNFIEKRKLLLFIVNVCVAYLFHKTALFFLPLYFVYPMRINREKILLGTVISIALLAFGDQILTIMNMYATNQYSSVREGGFTLLITYWAMVVLIDLFAYPIENEKYMKLDFIALLYSAIIQPLCFTFGGFARAHLYTWFGLVLGIPKFVRYISRNYDWRNAFIMKIAVTVVMIAWFFATEDTRGISIIYFN